MDVQERAPKPKLSLRTTFPISNARGPSLEQLFQQQFLRASVCRTTLKKLQRNLDISKKIKPPWQRAESSVASDTESDLTNSCWKPPSYLFVDYTKPRLGSRDCADTDSGLTLCDEFKIDELSPNSDEHSDIPSSVCSENLKLRRDPAKFPSKKKVSATSERIQPALPLTTLQLRQRLFQVADPALKYSTITASPEPRDETGNREHNLSSSMPMSSSHELEPTNDQLGPHSCVASTLDIASGDGSCVRADLMAHSTSDICSGSICTSEVPAPRRREPDVTILRGLGCESIFEQSTETGPAFWWDIPSDRTAIGRALANNREVANERYTSDFNPTQSTFGSNISMRKYGQQSCIVEPPATQLSLDLEECEPERLSDREIDGTQAIRVSLWKLPRRLRSRILLLAIGIDHQFEQANHEESRYCNPVLLQDDISKPNDFLKMTPSEKKAFYSSIGMNRIGSGIDLSNTTAIEHVEEVGTSKWITITRPESLERWCRRCNSEAHLRPDSLIIILWDPSMVQIDSVRQLFYYEYSAPQTDTLRRLSGAVASVDQTTSELDGLLRDWTNAMRRLPRRVQEVYVNATLPHWFDRQELVIALAQMQCYVMFRTGGPVNWVQNIISEDM